MIIIAGTSSGQQSAKEEEMTVLKTSLAPDDKLHGFTITAVTELPQIRSTAVQCRHDKSGAQLIHLLADDKENLFSIAFRTPPPDSTGLPHILEHTVLCGSEKYPVKDPFVELLKTSLATFLNAMTYPDKTVYPVASMNRNDFFNLMGVYCDATLKPLITEKHFKQEGHHFEFSEAGNPESELTIKGIVYNEMKGAYSDLDGIISREIMCSLCPDNAYGFDSGGNPEVIPELTYEKFVEFHKTYYHPANSFIFLYGDIPTEEHLAFLDREYLGSYEQISISTGIDKQPRWSEPQKETVSYPVGSDDTIAGKTAVTLTWLTNDLTDVISSLSMEVLDFYLLGNAASPLRKALIDSKLGEELTDSGYCGFQRDTFFTAGLKGTEPGKADEIEKLIIDTCRRCVDDGLDADKLASAFHRLELHAREIQSAYPLRLMDRVYNTWIYDADPLYLLSLSTHLESLRKQYESTPQFFEKQLRELVIDNPHYIRHLFKPDPEYVARSNERFAENMKQKKATMSAEQLAVISKEAEELEAMQSAPNTPEALATLPRLQMSDISPDPMELDTTVSEVAGAPLLNTRVFSDGISYLQLSFDLGGIDEELIDYLPLYADVMTRLGAGDDDYVKMAEREAEVTGGIGSGVGASGHAIDTDTMRLAFSLSTKALDRNVTPMLALLTDRITSSDLTELDRLKDVILQKRIHFRSSIIPAGNRYASLYAQKGLSRVGSLSERMSGITYLRMLEDVADNFEARQDELVARLTRVKDFVLGRGRVAASFVGSDAALAITEDWYKEFLGSLRDESPQRLSNVLGEAQGARDGIATPANVAFVAKALKGVTANHPDSPALLLLGLHLTFGYLWNEIRVKGGAYGGGAGYDPLGGIFTFSSYRDPNIAKTLKAYGGSFDYITSTMDLSEEAIEQAIIGTVKTLDRPIRPAQAVGAALSRHLNGQSVAFRKDFRDRLLSLTGEDIMRVTKEILEPAFDSAPVCAVSSKEKLEENNKILADSPLRISEL